MQYESDYPTTYYSNGCNTTWNLRRTGDNDNGPHQMETKLITDGCLLRRFLLLGELPTTINHFRINFNYFNIRWKPRTNCNHSNTLSTQYLQVSQQPSHHHLHHQLQCTESTTTTPASVTSPELASTTSETEATHTSVTQRRMVTQTCNKCVWNCEISRWVLLRLCLCVCDFFGWFPAFLWWFWCKFFWNNYCSNTNSCSGKRTVARWRWKNS